MASRLILFILLGAIAACSHPDERVSHTLTIGMAQMPATLDPRYATDAYSVRVQELIHRGLVRLDEHFQVVPDLAVSWEYPSKQSIRFRLRRGIRFHNGRELTAKDVAATLKAVCDPAMGSPLRSQLQSVTKIVVEDAYTIRLDLSRPDAALLAHLNLGVLPASLASAPQQAHFTIGCGAYRIAEWKNGRGLKLVPAVRRDLFTLRFLRVKDPVTRVLKLVRGELDLVQNDLPIYLIPFLKRHEAIHVRMIPSTTFSYLGLNLHDPHLKDVRVRQALALAIDREKLKQGLMAGIPRLAETVLPPGHWAAASLPLTMYDPEKAERLLDAAGFPRGSDGIRFRLTYRTSTDPLRMRLAVAIASMWEHIGIETRVESMEWGGFYARIKQGDFQVYSLSWVGIVDPDVYRWILHSSMWPPKGANRGRFADPKVDAWLDQGARALDMDERRGWYLLVQQRMHEAFVYIPLWYEAVVVAAGDRASSFRPRPDGSLRGLLELTQSSVSGRKKLSRLVITPSNTCRTSPSSHMASSDPWTSTRPPGISMVKGRTCPSRCQTAAAVAQAPDPQASVLPAPRSMMSIHT
ncbi:MAG: ABC transporter substrate-binding protein [Zetaproteobacteria bacterium]|nr:MAG: ABC transporter substrate-binding protein [Zetaproteobacteria bacterium]